MTPETTSNCLQMESRMRRSPSFSFLNNNHYVIHIGLNPFLKIRKGDTSKNILQPEQERLLDRERDGHGPGDTVKDKGCCVSPVHGGHHLPEDDTKTHGSQNLVQTLL
jgi:hypothetical protein